jgi:hypothetical protein
MALVGVPRDDRQMWLAEQTPIRVAEAIEHGASQQQAHDWAQAWLDFVQMLITWRCE